MGVPSTHRAGAIGWPWWRSGSSVLARLVLRGAVLRTPVLAVLGGVLGSPPAQAEEQPRDPTDVGVFSFVWENDYFADTDRNYTNGVRLSYVSPAQKQGSLAHELVGGVLDLGASDEVRFGLALGHSIFTPEDTEVVPAPSDQHPYAAWLYGEYSVFVDKGEQADTLALQLGVIGPSAQGEYVQNTFHDIINSYEVLGWDNQLEDEIGVNVIFERKERRVINAQLASLDFDATPTWGFSLGNVRTQANAGVMFRLGTDLAADFGPPRVRPALGGTSYFEPNQQFNWYLFAGVEGRAVARNIFLDGNTFQDSPSVERNPWVADVQFGAVAQFRDVKLGYTAVFRTEEFTEQSEPQLFGAVSLSTRF